MAANSPFFYGKELWRETRIALFEQATDTRPEELKAQGVRPRVWFGERWITSIFDLFEENVRYFPALLPVCEDEDPLETLERGRRPRASASCGCTTARSTAGTARSTTSSATSPTSGSRTASCPPGPTVVDILANAAFYYGLLRVMADEERPVWSQMSFSAAEENFHSGARDGIDARLYWPGLGEVPAAELVAQAAAAARARGPQRSGVDSADIDRLLGIIERRCVTLRNGASWQSEMFHHLYDSQWTATRPSGMTQRYREHMHSNEPVHDWPVD